jgi:hypothetical protein
MSAASFVPVEVVLETARPPFRARSATVDVVLRHRRRVRVGADFDAALLSRVVQLLEAIP